MATRSVSAKVNYAVRLVHREIGRQPEEAVLAFWDLIRATSPQRAREIAESKHPKYLAPLGDRPNPWRVTLMDPRFEALDGCPD